MILGGGRATRGLAVALAAVLVAGGSVLAFTVVGLSKCDGDGGVPYSAGDSPAAELLSLGCSDSDQRAYDRWVAAGQTGRRPADCETY